MTRYDRLLKELQATGMGKIKVFGQSMLPIIRSGSLLTFKRQKEYTTGDIVCCKVKGNMIGAHHIVSVCDSRGYLIANNKGHQNGYTRTVYGKVVKAQYKNNTKEFE
mmetsp:Transcript_5672/g.8606  ORF Transcript_5672/g.8606 Transcript_5672/m.8606 type:complete len:107 (-) Transcript_5672:54-374(-)